MKHRASMILVSDVIHQIIEPKKKKASIKLMYVAVITRVPIGALNNITMITIVSSPPSSIRVGRGLWIYVCLKRGLIGQRRAGRDREWTKRRMWMMDLKGGESACIFVRTYTSSYV